MYFLNITSSNTVPNRLVETSKEELKTFTPGLYASQIHKIFAIYMILYSFGDIFMYIVVLHKITNDVISTYAYAK